MAIAGIIFFTCLICAVYIYFRQPGRRYMRHQIYYTTAQRVMQRLKTLNSDSQRLVYLRKINCYVFEELILLAFKNLNLQVIRNKSYSRDGGIDGQVIINGQRWLIQAKRYSRTISPAHVRDFTALLRRSKCNGFFIHTGRTGKMSRAAIYCTPRLKIISGQKLTDLLMGRESIWGIIRGFYEL